MTRAAVSKLKARLSEYLARVRSGEEVLVTDHGLPVAWLIPLESRASFPEELQEMERQGRIRLGSGKLPRGFWKRQRPADPEASVRRAVAEDREGRP